MKKGMSPMIAAVFLIVITIVIAGIISSFATTLTKQQLENTVDVECIGAIDISSLNFENGVISFKLKNLAKIELENLKAVVEYSNITKNSQYDLLEKLSPGEIQFPVIDTGESDKPLKIEVISSTCPKNSAVLNFR